MFPLLLATEIDWAREAVAAGAVIQVPEAARLCFQYSPPSGVRIVCRGTNQSNRLCGSGVVCGCDCEPNDFVHAVLGCVRVVLCHLSQPGAHARAHIARAALILRKVDAPERVLKAEFAGELAFLPVAAVCLFYAQSLSVLIVVVGVLWWVMSTDWIPELLEPTKGTNPLFMAGWMCTSSAISALLLSAIFIVSAASQRRGCPLTLESGVAGVFRGRSSEGNLHWPLSAHGRRV